MFGDDKEKIQVDNIGVRYMGLAPWVSKIEESLCIYTSLDDIDL